MTATTGLIADARARFQECARGLFAQICIIYIYTIVFRAPTCMLDYI
jgi:hypothetical protein